MPEKEDSEEISSDGEFNEFKDFQVFPQDDDRFVEDTYHLLLNEKYQNDKELLNRYLTGRYMDDELVRQAYTKVHENAKKSKYLNKRLVTTNEERVAPRWASDMDHILTIAKKQQETIGPDAVFGRIDPRDTSTFKLKEMFSKKW